MTKQRFVSGVECRNLLEDMVRKHAALTLTSKMDDIWRVYKSHFLSIRANQLVLSQPTPDVAECHMEPAAGQQVAVGCKKGYNKYLFVTRVIKLDRYEFDSGESVPTITVYAPDHMEKIQRRAYERASIPQEHSIAVRFWRSDQADAAWTGRLANLSAGGLAVLMPQEDAAPLDQNEQLLLRFAPLPTQQPLCFEVRFRRSDPEPDSSDSLLAFQFMGLEMSEEGRRALRQISRAVGVFRRRRPLAEHKELQPDS